MAKTSLGTEKKTKAQLKREQQEALGKCRSLIEKKGEPEECRNWALDENGYCGLHFASAMNRRLAEEQLERKKQDLAERIDRFIEWTKDHPHVWDQMP